MSKKTKGIIVVLLAVLVLVSAFIGNVEKGTIIAFVDNAIVIELESGTKVVRYENYHTYIPTGEQWSVGDKVKIRDGLFELSIHCLAE